MATRVFHPATCLFYPQERPCEQPWNRSGACSKGLRPKARRDKTEKTCTHKTNQKWHQLGSKLTHYGTKRSRNCKFATWKSLGNPPDPTTSSSLFVASPGDCRL